METKIISATDVPPPKQFANELRPEAAALIKDSLSIKPGQAVEIVFSHQEQKRALSLGQSVRAQLGPTHTVKTRHLDDGYHVYIIREL